MHRKTSYRSTLKLGNLYPLCRSSGTKYNLQICSGQVIGANKSFYSGRTFEVPSPSSGRFWNHTLLLASTCRGPNPTPLITKVPYCINCRVYVFYIQNMYSLLYLLWQGFNQHNHKRRIQLALLLIEILLASNVIFSMYRKFGSSLTRN